eukprot:13707284-Alexandrium_andersonii.AAC.1
MQELQAREAPFEEGQPPAVGSQGGRGGEHQAQEDQEDQAARGRPDAAQEPAGEAAARAQEVPGHNQPRRGDGRLPGRGRRWPAGPGGDSPRGALRAAAAAWRGRGGRVLEQAHQGCEGQEVQEVGAGHLAEALQPERPLRGP